MKKSVAITILTLTILLYIVASCTSKDARLGKLDGIDSLMELNPQTAYDSLCHSKEQMTANGPQGVNMRYRLLMAKAQNKLYLQMPSDSAFQEVVEYYDNNGSSNDKMQAYYLQGCIYRDQKEAPKAMLSYQKAIECADTLSKSCDYSTLYKVYGQMNYVYRCQFLHEKAIEAVLKYRRFALLAKNTAEYVNSYSRMAIEYYALGDTLKAIEQVLKANRLYHHYGMPQEAARVFPKLIYFYLNRAQYDKAHHYMQIYENSSGLFDGKHHIAKGYEHYYKAKGMYYLGVHQLDSAEYYYRKLGHYGFRYETAQGLLSVYAERHRQDSIVKYSRLSEREMDRILNGNQAKAVVLASSLYDYSNLQREMEEEKFQKERNRYAVALLGACLLLVILYLLAKYRRMKKNMARKIAVQTQEYMRILNEKKKKQHELELLQGDVDILRKEKQEEICDLQTRLQEYEEKLRKQDLMERYQTLMDSGIVQKIQDAASPKKAVIALSSGDWDKLTVMMRRSFPSLHSKMRIAKLSSQELQVCMLVFIGLGGIEIANIIHTSSKVVCNAKQKINYKLFGDNYAATLYDNLREIAR